MKYKNLSLVPDTEDELMVIVKCIGENVSESDLETLQNAVTDIMSGYPDEISSEITENGCVNVSSKGFTFDMNGLVCLTDVYYNLDREFKEKHIMNAQLFVGVFLDYGVDRDFFVSKDSETYNFDIVPMDEFTDYISLDESAS